MRAWYFSDGRERYGQKRTQAVGVTHTVEGKIIPCKRGLHGSERAIDALSYGHGSIAWVVELGGTIVPHGTPVDKHAASERTYLARVDATGTLHEFACWCAERALRAERKAGREPHPDSWNAIKVKRAWLKGKATDEELAAARSGARDAAWAAARSAAGSGARDAAGAAAGAAAWDGAAAAAESGARAAAGSGARAAAWDGAWDGERKAQNRKLEAMVREAMAAVGVAS